MRWVQAVVGALLAGVAATSCERREAAPPTTPAAETNEPAVSVTTPAEPDASDPRPVADPETAPSTASDETAPPQADAEGAVADNGAAPGAPGETGFWTFAGKTGVGASYERYLDGAFSDEADTGVVSRVWFTLAENRLSEISFREPDARHIRDVRFIVAGPGFVDNETDDMVSATTYLAQDQNGRPVAPAYRIESHDRRGDYVLTRDILTDPDAQAVAIQLRFEARVPDLALYLIVDPAMAGTGPGDRARASTDALSAHEEGSHVVVLADQPFEAASAGFAGVSDGDRDLRDGGMDWAYAHTGEASGDVVLSAQLLADGVGVHDHLLAIGFGDADDGARAEAERVIAAGFEDVRARFVGEGDHIGWSDYLASLPHLDRLAAQSGDGGRLAAASVLVIKSLERRSAPGDVIAYPAVAWGTRRSAAEPMRERLIDPWAGHAAASALAALGDAETARAILRRVETRGRIGAVQVARLGALLLAQGADEWLETRTFAAADTLVDMATFGGAPEGRWGARGLSPIAMSAAAAAGLEEAAALAEARGESERADRYRQAAQRFLDRIADGFAAGLAGEDAGALLVATLGLRPPFDPDIAAALARIDAIDPPDGGRLRYRFRQPDAAFTGWRRYAYDGYGESVGQGVGFLAGDRTLEDYRGRVWPLLTAERGRFELRRAMADGELTPAERAVLHHRFVRAMETFANEGLMLPQQVWDGVGANPDGYIAGQGSGAPAPHMWSHAEYLVLLAALAEVEGDVAQGAAATPR